MSSLKEIRDQIQIDANILSDVSFPDVRLNNIINQAQRYVQAELNGLGMKRWETSSALSLSLLVDYAGISTNQMNIPADMLESPKSIIQIELNDGGVNDGLGKEVNKSDFFDINGNTFLAPTITQPIFMRLDNKIIITPNTACDGTLHYYKMSTTLSVDADVSDIPSEFIEYVVRRSVSQIEKVQGKVNQSQVQEANLKKDIADAYGKFVGKMDTEKTTETLQ